MLWTGQSNYEIDYSLGGTLIIVGNLIIQSCSSPNKIMLAYHSEDPDAGQANSAEEMYVTNNTFVDICEGTTTNFIRTNKVNPTIQVIQNNIFAGAAAGSMIWATGSGSGVAQTDPANNQKYATVAAANFVDATNQNYHLTGSSTAIDAATVDPAAVYGVSLIPDKYYVHPRSTATRTTTGVRRDLGAYESNASLTGTVPAPVAYALPTATTIVLSWPPPITDTDITQYRVLRNAAALATVTNAYTYTDSTAAADTTYSYTVIADHAGGSSAASAPVVSHRIKQVSGTLAPDLGWQEILNTTLNTVINPATSNFDVFYHTALTLDTQSNRILIWGNGQTRPDNSVYALNMNTLTVAQLNTPQSGTCTAGTLTSGVGTGRPCGRQTRDSLAWLSNVNKMFGWGGYVGGFQTDTWLWTPGTDTWEKKTPTGTAPPSADYPFSTYDPVSQKALVLDKACLTFYDPLTDAWSRGAAGCVVSSGAVVNGAVDPIRHRLYTFGAFTGYFDLDTGSFTALPANNNCTPLIDTDPGLVWEAQLGKMVGWIGGDTIYLLDPVTNTCTTQEIAAGPGYAENTLAAFNVGKRLQYHPPTGTLIAFTDTDRNAFALRLSTVTTGANQQTGGGRRAGGGQEK
jgi:hypothetical protein